MEVIAYYQISLRTYVDTMLDGMVASVVTRTKVRQRIAFADGLPTVNGAFRLSSFKLVRHATENVFHNEPFAW